MTVPDKIYVHTGVHLGMLTLTTIPVNASEEQEYISKKTLLEWIQEARAIPHENAITRDLAFQEIINKINSM